MPVKLYPPVAKLAALFAVLGSGTAVVKEDAPVTLPEFKVKATGLSIGVSEGDKEGIAAKVMVVTLVVPVPDVVIDELVGRCVMVTSPVNTNFGTTLEPASIPTLDVVVV